MELVIESKIPGRTLKGMCGFGVSMTKRAFLAGFGAVVTLKTILLGGQVVV